MSGGGMSALSREAFIAKWSSRRELVHDLDALLAAERNRCVDEVWAAMDRMSRGCKGDHHVLVAAWLTNVAERIGGLR